MAADDPEGWTIYERVRKKAKSYIENGDVFLITSDNNVLVNVLQQASTVIIQKSIREGFGLTVTESLWKKTPVVGSNVGGITLQIKDGENGFIVDPFDIKKCAERVIDLIKDSEKRKKMGEKGREHVRKNFLMTRLLKDYLELLNETLL